LEAIGDLLGDQGGVAASPAIDNEVHLPPASRGEQIAKEKGAETGRCSPFIALICRSR